MTHTPGPWSIDDTYDDRIYIESDRRGVCTIPLYEDDCLDRARENFANAEFITRACNAHYDLLNALELAYGSMCDVYIDFENNPKGKKMMAAIAKAKEDKRKPRLISVLEIERGES